MAVPKRRTSKSRRDTRRSHLALQPVNLVHCKNCGAQFKSHHICAECGFYKGKEIIKVK